MIGTRQRGGEPTGRGGAEGRAKAEQNGVIRESGAEGGAGKR